MSSPLWLASGSPRRQQLLEWAGLQVEVRPPRIPESRHPDESPVDYATRLATEKAATAPADRLALAADTVVHFDDHVLEKPRDRQEAIAHLRTLSGRWHAVTTGVSLHIDTWSHTFATTTRVRFRALTDMEIATYAATGEGDDKAGAYAIQGRGGALVAELAGSWTNVMGLPLEHVLSALANAPRVSRP